MRCFFPIIFPISIENKYLALTSLTLEYSQRKIFPSSAALPNGSDGFVFYNSVSNGNPDIYADRSWMGCVQDNILLNGFCRINIDVFSFVFAFRNVI